MAWNLHSRIVLTTFCLLGLAACGLGGFPLPTDPAEPAFDPANFAADSADVDHPYFPLVPGTARLFRVETEDGIETTVVEVLDDMRVVGGVTCAIVCDSVYLDELLIEKTFDWYAQDVDGNVWYLGEDSESYEYDEEGNLVDTSTDGSWETGLDVAGVGSTAEPGIIMKADFVVGDTYRQEYYEGEAEDMAEIVGVDVPVELLDGRVLSCLKTRDWNPLAADSTEFKYYAAGIGVILEEQEDGSEPVEHLGVFVVTDASLPDIEDATFSDPSSITHPFLPYAPGSVWEYESETEDGLETTLVEALATTREVDGLACRVVRDRVYLDGVLIEDTHDWYAQDDDGNVWYLGEEVVNYEYDDEGNLLGTNDDGSWEAGVDGAVAGVLLWATPVVGTSYRQEYYEDEAEDMGLVFAVDVTVELEGGDVYPGCLQTLEWSPLEPAAMEFKYYGPGVGVVLEHPLHVDERVELTGP